MNTQIKETKLNSEFNYQNLKNQKDVILSEICKYNSEVYYYLFFLEGEKIKWGDLDVLFHFHFEILEKMMNFAATNDLVDRKFLYDLKEKNYNLISKKTY